MKLKIAPWRPSRAMNLEYVRYMRSSAWEQKRKQVLKRACFRCDHCAAEGVPLEVHHKTYRRFKHEALEDLEALCQECHKSADFQRKRCVEMARHHR